MAGRAGNWTRIFVRHQATGGRHPPGWGQRPVAFLATKSAGSGDSSIVLTLIAALLLPLQDARELIQKLQSDKAGERDDAGRKLKELGDAAIPELESASKGKDPEVAARARALLRAIEIRRKLTPKLL